MSIACSPFPKLPPLIPTWNPASNSAKSSCKSDLECDALASPSGSPGRKRANGAKRLGAGSSPDDWLQRWFLRRKGGGSSTKLRVNKPPHSEVLQIVIAFGKGRWDPAGGPCPETREDRWPVLLPMAGPLRERRWQWQWGPPRRLLGGVCSTKSEASRGVRSPLPPKSPCPFPGGCG